MRPMGIEIERKFLVCGPGWRQGQAQRYSQGYLNRAAERTVRVRIAGEQAFLTIKGRSQGASRLEFEYPLPLADAQALLQLCEGPLIDKTRYTLEQDGLRWEVDEFHGENAGLVLAEVELPSEDQTITRPDWLGEEVTGDERYYNSRLSELPFGRWPR